MQEFGLKELYDLVLKVTYPIEMNGRVFQEGEVIARFDKIRLANFQEITNRVTANGGYGNEVRVVWEDPKEIQFSFTQGIFSKQQYTLMSNSRLLEEEDSGLWIHKGAKVETQEDGTLKLPEAEVRKIFLYDSNFRKIDYTLEDGIIKTGLPYKDISVEYEFKYTGTHQTLLVGKKLVTGFLALEGKTRVKDDETGKTHTAILRIPKLKLMSDLSMRLGLDATPIVGSLKAVGLPSGAKGDKKVMELIFLDDDIDADI